MNVIRQPFLALFAWGVWARLPSVLQFFLSRITLALAELHVSRYFIRPYAWFNYRDHSTYLDEFAPARGGQFYKTFQDFFTRRLKRPRPIASEFVWPCDGLLCDVGRVSEFGPVKVKGNLLPVSAIFGADFSIPRDSYFANVFLHNRDYHRIHAPVGGEIVRIKRIPGELKFLRPWLYRQPSLPAFTNERVNMEIRTDDGEGRTSSWFLSIVGGPGVSTIELDPGIKVGSRVTVAQEIALFRLGSTCCMVAPVELSSDVGSKVLMGQVLRP